jgi:hypothetical protein
MAGASDTAVGVEPATSNSSQPTPATVTTMPARVSLRPSLPSWFMLASMPTGPNRLRVIEGLLAILRAAGFGDQVAAWAMDRLQIYIDADVYEGALYAAKIKQGLEVEEYLDSTRDYFRRLPADRFPVIASMADTIVADSDQRFEFGVELLLDGLTAHLQAGR